VSLRFSERSRDHETQLVKISHQAAKTQRRI